MLRWCFKRFAFHEFQETVIPAQYESVCSSRFLRIRHNFFALRIQTKTTLWSFVRIVYNMSSSKTSRFELRGYIPLHSHNQSGDMILWSVAGVDVENTKTCVEDDGKEVNTPGRYKTQEHPLQESERCVFALWRKDKDRRGWRLWLVIIFTSNATTRRLFASFAKQSNCLMASSIDPLLPHRPECRSTTRRRKVACLPHEPGKVPPPHTALLANIQMSLAFFWNISGAAFWNDAIEIFCYHRVQPLIFMVSPSFPRTSHYGSLQDRHFVSHRSVCFLCILKLEYLVAWRKVSKQQKP